MTYQEPTFNVSSSITAAGYGFAFDAKNVRRTSDPLFVESGAFRTPKTP